MARLLLPYSNGFLETEVPDNNLAAVLESRAHGYRPTMSQESLVEAALDRPIGSPPLEELARGKRNIVIITSDHTRPVPSRITLPALLRRIRKTAPECRVTILIATGFHRPTASDEILSKFGPEIAENEHIVNHDCRDTESLVYLGVLPSGAELHVNRLAVEADLLVADGFIEPHFFAGFSGGRKSVLPGIVGERTVLANHCAKFIAHPNCRTGVLEGNPMHEDMLEASRRVSLRFILNVVIDAQKQVVAAFAGDPRLAHEEGCGFVRDLAQVEAVPADIVITTNGGYPLDQNIYQTVKGMTAAESTAREGAVIIIASACSDGHGGESFYRTFRDAPDLETIERKILATPMEDTVPDQWESQILTRILLKHRVILVTRHCDPQMITDLKMEHAFTVEDAMKKAFAAKGSSAAITVIPDGVSVIVV
ncbi:MAG: nickel-dependent lactate racemase [Firmicutes bacterium]|nr:nickel-dependent lactate racemase [Bacillota bacterium]